MTKEEYKKYMKGALNTTKLVTTEAVGYGVAGNIAGSITGPGADVASKAFATGSSLAGMPSLAYAAGNLTKSVESIFKQKKRR